MARTVAKNGGVSQYVLGKLTEGVETIGNRAVNVLSSYRLPNMDEETVRPKKYGLKQSNMTRVVKTKGAVRSKRMSSTKLHYPNQRSHQSSSLNSKLVNVWGGSGNFGRNRSNLIPAYTTRRFSSGTHGSNTSLSRHPIPNFKPSRAQPQDWRMDSISRSSKLTTVATNSSLSTVRNQLMRTVSSNERQAREISTLISSDLMPISQSVKDLIRATPNATPLLRSHPSLDDASEESKAHKFEGWNRPDREKLMAYQRSDPPNLHQELFERNRLMRIAGGRSKNTSKMPTATTTSAISSAEGSFGKDNPKAGQMQAPMHQQRARRTCIPGCGEGEPPKSRREEPKRSDADAERRDHDSESAMSKRSLGQTLTARAFAPMRDIEIFNFQPSISLAHKSAGAATPTSSKKHSSSNSASSKNATGSRYKSSRSGGQSREARKPPVAEVPDMKASMTVVIASSLPKPVHMFNTKHYPANRY